MKLDEFKKEKENFLSYITVEKNLSIHTQKAYHSDLNQFIIFWGKAIDPEESNTIVKILMY